MSTLHEKVAAAIELGLAYGRHRAIIDLTKNAAANNQLGPLEKVAAQGGMEESVNFCEAASEVFHQLLSE